MLRVGRQVHVEVLVVEKLGLFDELPCLLLTVLLQLLLIFIVFFILVDLSLEPGLLQGYGAAADVASFVPIASSY